MASDITNRVLNIIEEVSGYKPENLDEDLKDLGLDSLDIVDVIMRTETEFNISIPDDVAEDIETTQHLIQIVERYVGNTGRF